MDISELAQEEYSLTLSTERVKEKLRQYMGYLYNTLEDDLVNLIYHLAMQRMRLATSLRISRIQDSLSEQNDIVIKSLKKEIKLNELSIRLQNNLIK